MRRESVTISETGADQLRAVDNGDGVLVELEGDNFLGTIDFESKVAGDNWFSTVYQVAPAASPANSVAQLSVFEDDTPKRFLVLPPYRQLRVNAVVLAGSIALSWAEVRLATRPA